MGSNEEFQNISFDLPKHQSNVINVIGVGGGGSNAINYMFKQGIKGVDFVICNTDAQALENSPIPNKIQLGVSLTEGLGAGANPEIGEKAALESYEDIKNMLGTNTKMIFITAGMGGGTGTGAAPVIAKMAKEMDILTVGIVTIPFHFEGRMRNQQAQLGVEKLRSHVDSLIVINNNKLREVYGNLGFKAGFSKADEVLATASRGIAEVITHHYTQNIDLRDAKTVLSNSGTAIMGSANSTGDNRAKNAITKALDSPLLNDNKITGAKDVLLLIVSGKEEITIDEIGEINDYIQREAGHSANIIMGVGEDESLDEAISVTVIATGFDVEQQDEIVNSETKKIIHTLEDEQKAKPQLLNPKSNQVVTPTTPVITQQQKNNSAPIIKHKLTQDDFEEQDAKPPQQSQTNPPNPSENTDEDFIIINTQDILKQIEVEEDQVDELGEGPTKLEDEDAFSFSFEAPLVEDSTEKPEDIPADTSGDNRIVYDLSDERTYTNAQESESIRNQNSRNPVKKYDVSNENTDPIKASEPESNTYQTQDPEAILDKKTVSNTAVNDLQTETDPVNMPISETLKARAAERRARMKEFNYKFRNSYIDEIEKEPAYRRAGIELHDVPEERAISRTSVGTDQNDNLQLRNNNSFLHDNVD